MPQPSEDAGMSSVLDAVAEPVAAVVAVPLPPA
jgi:hypothetical protein